MDISSFIDAANEIHCEAGVYLNNRQYKKTAFPLYKRALLWLDTAPLDKKRVQLEWGKIVVVLLHTEQKLFSGKPLNAARRAPLEIKNWLNWLNSLPVKQIFMQRGGTYCIYDSVYAYGKALQKEQPYSQVLHCMLTEEHWNISAAFNFLSYLQEGHRQYRSQQSGVSTWAEEYLADALLRVAIDSDWMPDDSAGYNYCWAALNSLDLNDDPEKIVKAFKTLMTKYPMSSGQALQYLFSCSSRITKYMADLIEPLRMQGVDPQLALRIWFDLYNTSPKKELTLEKKVILDYFQRKYPDMDTAIKIYCDITPETKQKYDAMLPLWRRCIEYDKSENIQFLLPADAFLE